jgi:archaellum component FlaC
MLIELEKIIDKLQNHVDSTDLNWFNDSTLIESKIEKDTYRKIIRELKELKVQ